MCVIPQTAFGGSMLFNGSAHRSLWYAPDRRIRTTAAAQRAAELAQGASRGYDLDAELDEQALFTALHTCAFRASRCAHRKQAVVGDHEDWSRGWYDLRECLVRRNLGLAYSMLSRVRSSDLDQDDRLSEALYGLVRAVERFNPWKGYRFSTYACNVIVRALTRRAKHEQRYRGLFPSQQEALREGQPSLAESRIDLWTERLSRAVEVNSADLTDIEARVLADRFPLQGGRCATFLKISHSVGLSKERVRQIQNVALKKLRTTLEVDPVLQ